jgi:hypothetical protein
MASDGLAPSPVPVRRIYMKQYKVLTQKDRFFAGKFDPEKLESALNSYAAEGWEVIAATTAEIPSIGRSREEMVVVLERGMA